MTVSPPSPYDPDAGASDSGKASSRRRQPRIVLLGMGGTIASSAGVATQLHDYTVTDTVEAVLAAVPQAHELADIRCEQLANIDSHAIDNAMLLQLARRAEAILQDPEVDGLVITHGTDTLEETAYFLNLTLKSAKPVVLVGAMRPATALSADGPLNLHNAIRLAACAEASGMGVLVMLNDRIGAARYVTKASTTVTDAFRSFEHGNLGEIAGSVVYLFNTPTRLHTLATDFSLAAIDELPHVDILYDYQGAGSHLYRAAIDAGARGIVLAATGNGSLSPAARLGAELATQRGVMFVRSSRVGQGVVTSLADDESLGLVAAGSLNPQKARVLLMLALGRTRDFRLIQGYFDRY
ncbi:asparaginase [Paraburkholderia sp. G-4-1-8]|uniref:Asparaginase n=2 Tax=Paraburkholderia antibiotica TaxID=2728839 RepID=A0A7Y0A2N4_9BURK|nr:asparaginase [Paraburkholderia antibiotica]